jgi:hypothetical protein
MRGLRVAFFVNWFRLKAVKERVSTHVERGSLADEKLRRARINSNDGVLRLKEFACTQ